MSILFRASAEPAERASFPSHPFSRNRSSLTVPAVVLMLALAGGTGCRLGELVNTPGLGQLAASPGTVVDSAAVGSRAVVARNIILSGSGTEVQAWSATRTGTGTWLALSRQGGTVPGAVTVSLDPTGLALGAHRDTIVFSAVGGTASPINVPVQFTIRPCDVLTITVGVTIQDSLVTADCEAPDAAEHFAKRYRFPAAAGDSVSLVLTSPAFDGMLRLERVAGGGAALEEADTCAFPGVDACIVYARLPEAAEYIAQVTTASAGRSGPFTLLVAPPRAPDAPSVLSQLKSDSATPVARGASLTDNTVVFSAALTDIDAGDSVRLEVEVRPAGTAFTFTPTAAGDAVPNGATAMAVMADLADDTDYHWQSRAVDRTGRPGPWAAFGAPTATDFHVAVPNAPNPPAALQQLASDGVSPIAVNGATDERTVLFRGVLTDDDPSDEVRLEVEVRPLGTAFSDRGVGSSVPVASGNAATATITGLDDDVAYHWQARAVDRLGNASAWVSFGNNGESDADFRVAVPGAPFAPTSAAQFRRDGTTAIAVGEVIDDDAVLVRATLTDPDPGDVLTLEVAVQPVGTVFTNSPTHTSGPVASGDAAAISVTDLSDDTDYHWRARTVDQLGNASAWTSFGGNPDGEVDFRVAIPASQLVFTTQPSDATAGSAIVPAVTVTAQEPSGNPDTSFAGTVAISLAPGTGDPSATLSGITSVAAVRGVASFTSLSIDRSGSGYRLAAAAAGLTRESDPFNVDPASAGRLVFSTAPAAAVESASPLDPQPVLQLEDLNGNPVNQSGVTVTAAIVSGPPNGTLGAETAVTDGTGRAAFSGLTLIGLVGKYRLQFSAPEVASVTSDTITVSAGPAVGLALTTQPAGAAQSGVPFTRQPVVQLEDAGGNPVGPSGIQVTAAIDSGGGTLTGATTVGTDAGGAASFSDLSIDGTVGTRRLRFSASGLNAVTSAAIAVTAGDPTDMSIHAGDNQTAVAGTAVPIAPAVVVTDASGNRVTGVAVTFAVATGGGTVNPTTPVSTDADGIAAAGAWTLGTSAGSNTLTATASGLNGSPATFTATATAGSAGGLAILTQPSAAAESGVPFPRQPVVQIQDENGNPVAQAGVVVTAGVASGPGGVLSGDAQATTDAAGRATFVDLGVDGTVGSYTLAFSATGLTGVTSDGVQVGPGPPSRLALSVQPSDEPRNGIVFATQPSVQVEDAAGNAVATADIDVVVGILSGGGSLGGTTTVSTNASGVATYTDLSLTGTIGDRTLIFAAVGLQSVISNTVSLTAGDPSSLVLTIEPSANAQNGLALAQQPAVELRDQSDNVVALAGVDVTASIATGGGTLGGALTATTDATGSASFTNLSITGTVGTRTLRFTADGVTPVISGGIQITAGPAARVAVTTEPAPSATNGVALSTQPVLRLEDVSGNPVAAPNVPLTASINSGAGALSGVTTIVTDSSGSAGYTDLTITGLVGEYVLQFSSAGLDSALSAVITLEPGAATGLALTTQPSDTVQAGMVFPRQPVVQAVDQSGNAVALAGVDVAAAILSGGGALLGTTTVTTDAAGTATYTDLAIAGLPGDRVLLFAAGGLQSVSSDTVTVTP